VNRRRALRLLALGPAASACFAGTVGAEEPKLARADWTAIKRVVSQQLAALRAGDGDRAFSYASPGIRAQFDDARSFMAMVRAAYAPLLDARHTEFLEGAVVDGLIVQPLRLIGRDNRVLVALYTVEKQKGSWRITGCRLAPSPVQAV